MDSTNDLTQVLAAGLLFDDFDTFYLANAFPVPELLRDIHEAELAAFVADAYRGTPYESPQDLFPWIEFTAACREAIKWQQHSKSKTKPGPGRVDVEGIKSRADIVAVAEYYTKLRKSGKNFTGLCPFHNEKHGSFFVYPEQQSWYCFGDCNTGGDVFSFVMRAENTDFKGAATILGGQL